MRIRLAAAVALAPLLDVTLLGRLPFPAPDLSLAVAVAAGVLTGPVSGAVTGFAAGLVADLVPPALPPAGRSALLFCLAGYAAGWLARRLPGTAGVFAASAAGGLLPVLAALLLGVWPGAPAPEPGHVADATAAIALPDAGAALAAFPCNLIAGPLMWRLLIRRRRASRRLPDATLTLPAATGAPAGGGALHHLARTAVAGADRGRRALHPSRRRRPRTPHRHPARARAHPR
ncbi:hypothetical protein WBK31_28255 [Nonomuraea sp. N2-4H]|jgi:hypothetical protein|uniref:hypothetical protein n=1 Tax=Nonomuraea sp. NPDC052634 TaxID=3155813 RepID=UPI0032562628